MTPYGFGPTGWGCPTCGPGPGMGYQNAFQPGFGAFGGGNWAPGFAGAMGYPTSFQFGVGNPYLGTFPQGVIPTLGCGPGFAGTVNPMLAMPWPTQRGWGLGGLRGWGGTYSPQFTLTGLPTDEEIVEMVYDSIDNDPLIPFDADINVDCDAGTVTLTGTVASKQIKHAAGDDAWWIPGVDDVHNDLNFEPRQPAHAARAPAMAPRRAARGMTTTGEAAPEVGQPEAAEAARAPRRAVSRR